MPAPPTLTPVSQTSATILPATGTSGDVSDAVPYGVYVHVDDFLNDVGRTTDDGNAYRAIHAQVMTKDGFTFELQIRLKDLDPLTEKSHKLRDDVIYKMDSLSAEQTENLWKQYKATHKAMNKKYFEIKDKEFSKLKSTDPMDIPIPIGTRIDDATGEKVPLTKTARELFEEDAKNATMLKRLENCV